MNKPTEIPADKLALYDKLVAAVPGVERKGASMPYTSHQGHMFSFLTPAGVLALRLPDGDREAFLKKYKTKLCEQHDVVMKEYVEVPASLFKKTAELKPFLEKALAYVGKLKPKATKRKKTAKTKSK